MYGQRIYSEGLTPEELNEAKKAKYISIAIMVIMFATAWYMLNMVLLTFIFVYVFYHLTRVVKWPVRRILHLHVPEWLITSILYMLFIGLLVLIVGEVTPLVIAWSGDFINQLSAFDPNDYADLVGPHVEKALENIDLSSILTSISSKAAGAIGNFTAGVTGFATNIFISMILSYMILLEKSKIALIGSRMENSRLHLVYEYVYSFGGSFCHTFGKVMSVQVLIAFINSCLSMVLLKLIGFSFIIPLGCMIFVFGLIPVAGVVCSFVPLTFLAFNLGGIIKVLEVIAMILVLHAVEAYILNPKLMSSKTNLPISFTFIILIVSEHYLGVWGLLIGVPIFIFFLDMLDVDYNIEKHKKVRKHNREAAPGGHEATEYQKMLKY